MKPTVPAAKPSAPASASASSASSGAAKTKGPMPVQRPRFRQSQRLGRNLRRHPRRQSLDGALPPLPPARVSGLVAPDAAVVPGDDVGASPAAAARPAPRGPAALAASPVSPASLAALATPAGPGLADSTASLAAVPEGAAAPRAADPAGASESASAGSAGAVPAASAAAASAVAAVAASAPLAAAPGGTVAAPATPAAPSAPAASVASAASVGLAASVGSAVPAVPAVPAALRGAAVERFPFRLWGADASVQDTYGGLFQQWQALRDFYGLRRRKHLRDYVKRLRFVDAVHPLQGLERRLDVVLHRSGLVNSVAQARQLMSHGFITVDGVVRTRPNAQVQASQLMAMDPTHWRAVQEPAARSQWSRWQVGQGRLMPNYREVDFRAGAFVVLGRCTREERLRPRERTPTPDVLRLRK